MDRKKAKDFYEGQDRRVSLFNQQNSDECNPAKKKEGSGLDAKAGNDRVEGRDVVRTSISLPSQRRDNWKERCGNTQNCCRQRR